MPRFAFDEVPHGIDETHHLAPGYRADILIRWGDPVTVDAPVFDPAHQSAAAQQRQFGYNNDFIGLVPLGDDRLLLCVNHEYTNEELMFPGLGRQDRQAFTGMTAEIAAVEMAAHGGSIVEIVRTGGRWSVDPNGRRNRRITASTAMMIAGPAAGDPRMRTAADPSGRQVLGTLCNCAGGITPWGTWLMAEENFNGYFQGGKEATASHPHAESLNRYGVPGGWYNWGDYDRRFDVGEEPNEPFRFGWIVEVDPTDPSSTPKKRTALGRFKHEGAETVLNRDGRLAVYSGDDQRFEYVYKFVTEGRYDPDDRAANLDLLDRGTLYVARFEAEGDVQWLPLVHGEGPLVAANGFATQADVLIDTRRAADLLGATPMDRPEDVEADPRTGAVYLMLTNNHQRTANTAAGPNARAANLWGQVVEILPEDGDHARPRGRWDVLVQCGDPADPGVGATWNPMTSADGWFACPDNCAVDPEGRLWIATDQGSRWRTTSGSADGLWALETSGPLRGTGRCFFRAPVGAELCGPRFTADMTTLFVAVQHPAADGVRDWPPFGRDSTFDDPATRWPDFRDGMPPRPSVVVITREGGGKIGF